MKTTITIYKLLLYLGQISQLTALRLYECGKFGVPIIHDTSLDITLDLITRSELGYNNN